MVTHTTPHPPWPKADILPGGGLLTAANYTVIQHIHRGELRRLAPGAQIGCECCQKKISLNVYLFFFPLVLGTEPPLWGHHHLWDTVPSPSPTPYLTPSSTRRDCKSSGSSFECFLFPGVSFAGNPLFLVAAARLDVFPQPDGSDGCWDVPDEPRGSHVDCVLSR